jgi:hypothetical protein
MVLSSHVKIAQTVGLVLYSILQLESVNCESTAIDQKTKYNLKRILIINLLSISGRDFEDPTARYIHLVISLVIANLMAQHNK